MTKLCVITGASKGLGRELSGCYQREEWQVYNLSRSAAKDAAVHVPCDFSDLAATEQVLVSLFESLSSETWTQIHVIHNAAQVGVIGPLASVSESTPQNWQQTLDVNLGAVVQLTGLFLRFFQKHPAEKLMATVSSGAAHKAYAGWSLYCATKAAVERLSLCVAEEQKQQAHPLQAVIINPGVMDTDMQAHIRQANPAYFPHLERFVRLKAEDALPQPEAVAAQCAAYLWGNPVSGETFQVRF